MPEKPPAVARNQIGCLWAAVGIPAALLIGLPGIYYATTTPEQRARYAAEAEADRKKEEAERAENERTLRAHRIADEQAASKSAEEKKVEEARSERELAVKVTADELRRSYESNEARAQQAWGNATYELTGTVDRIDLDVFDKPSIWLKSSNHFLGVVIDNNKDMEPFAVSLNKGQRITLLCHGASEVLGSPIAKGCKPVQ